MKPLIGITTEEIPGSEAWRPSVYGQNHHYTNAVWGAGGLPVLLPFPQDRDELRELYERLDGILFAGGGDIDPTEYGEAADPTVHDVSVQRDKTELQLMKWAIADDKPIFAICRGFQVLNVALGGSLIQDIPSQIAGSQNHELSSDQKDRTFLAHTLRLDPESRLAALIGADAIRTNTHHHQSVKKPAPGLRVTGWAEDGIVESGELVNRRFALGVQSHPESLVTLDAGWQKVFKAFVEAARSGYESAPMARKSSKTDVEVLGAL